MDKELQKCVYCWESFQNESDYLQHIKNCKHNPNRQKEKQPAD